MNLNITILKMYVPPWTMEWSQWVRPVTFLDEFHHGCHPLEEDDGEEFEDLAFQVYKFDSLSVPTL